MNSARTLTVRVGDAATTALVYTAYSIAVSDTSSASAVPDTGADPSFAFTGATLILAHGAGAGQQSAFMTDAARGLAALGVDVATFNFLYAEQRRRLPDRAPILEACYLAAIDAVRRAVPSAARATFIGGKSMGGRIATHVAAAHPDLPIAGIVLLGYPLHPPAKPTQRRDAHLPAVRCPVLFVQGSRDAFGTPAELEPAIAQMPAATIHAVAGGDHSLKPTGLDDPVKHAIVRWIDSIIRTRG